MKAFLFSQWKHLGCLCALLLCMLPAWGQSDYRIAPQDIIMVDVVGEKDLTRELRVSSSGTITFPFLGNLQVKDKTPAQVESEIRELLDKDYLVDPQVIVTIKDYRTRTVNVLGEVSKPGAVAIPGELKLTILDVIGMAGGLTPKADKGKIQFTRAGKTQVFKFEDLTKATDPSKKLFVEPGDMVEVRPSFF